tara:strand:- start:1683 stop:2006 length:324 start_codon:yes stop_codon:yes gene_type:complete
MIVPNLLKSKEYQALIDELPNAGLPQEIYAYNAGAFNFVGIRVKNGIGLKRDIQIELFTREYAMWHSTKDDFKTPQAMGNFHQVVMLHNPDIKEVKTTRRTTKKETE